MSKIYPNCHEIYDDNEVFCVDCLGIRLVDMDEKQYPTFSLGDANAISGGVSINQSKNITSHDTHYHSTTVHERSKSESELKLDANNQLRSKAEEIMAERGRIDSVAMNQLRPLSLQLGIDEETFKSIIKDVRSNRNGSTSGLSAANARYLQQAQQAIKTNDMDALSVLTARLEAMAAISQDDNVQFMHYLTYSLFYPLKSMEMYEHQTDENYWRTFWAIISYIRTGKYDEATSTLAMFDPLRYEKSEDDQNLLEAYFNIMKEDKDGAQDFLDEILGEPTEQVKPLLRAVESTLYEEDSESLEVRFYMDRVMTRSDVVVKSQSQKTQTVLDEFQNNVPLQEEDNFEEDIERGRAQDAFKKEDYLKALTIWEKIANKGNVRAMVILGNYHANGNGKVDKDYARAIEWYKKAADLGDADAMYALGYSYEFGQGVPNDLNKAVKCYRKAADLGNIDSMVKLGDCYKSFIDFMDINEAVKWYRKAADLGNEESLVKLGDCYNYEEDIQDYNEAVKWYKKAEITGSFGAEIYEKIGLCLESIKPAESIKWYLQGAMLESTECMGRLCIIYCDGVGIEADYDEAYKWAKMYIEHLDDPNSIDPLVEEKIEELKSCGCYSFEVDENASCILHEKAWVTQENEQNIGIHFAFNVTGQQGQCVSFRCVTRVSNSISKVVVNLHIEKSNPLNCNDTRWNDWKYFFNEKTLSNSLNTGNYNMETELQAIDSNHQELGLPYYVRYNIYYESNLFHKNKLILVNETYQGY